MKFIEIIMLFGFLDIVVSTKKDIIFLVDRSNSISSSQFKHTLHFLHNVTDFLQIGPQNILVSVVLFDKTAEAVFDFGSNVTKQSLLDAIDNIPIHTGTSTNTAAGLNYSQSLFTTRNGSRSDATKYVVVLTDGDSDDRLNTKHAADRLRRNNITVIGMGIGSSVSTDQITELTGGRNNVVSVTDFVFLCNKVPYLVTRLDSSVVNASVNGCPPEPTTTPHTPFFSTVVQQKIQKDIIFLVDRSNSISSSQFKHTLNFLHNVTDFLQIGPQNILVSVVLFDKTAKGVFDFGSYVTKQSLLNAIDNIPIHTGTSTNTAAGLNYSLSLFTTRNGSRSDATKYVVVLTDGDSDDRVNTENAADRLRRNNITVIGMGIGSSVSTDQITKLAGGPNNVVNVTDFVFLCNKVPYLVTRLDSSVRNTSVNGCPAEPTTTPHTPFFSTVVQQKIHKGGSQVGIISGATSAVCLLFLLSLLLFLLRKRFRKKTEPANNDVINGSAPRKTFL